MPARITLLANWHERLQWDDLPGSASILLAPVDGGEQDARAPRRRRHSIGFANGI
ncbi:MAG TPA: hypothetical protein VN837_10870 [Chloroflexota bacterium]|nr:hypothetical protein [Chloroflexota bacterium]